MKQLFRLAPVLALFAAPLSATTFTVTTTADSGAGSLRQAILDANANPGADTIAFNIVGSGVQTISLATALPNITDPVTLDGYTQPGSSPNTQDTSQGLDTVLVIQIDGSALPLFGVCLDLAASDSTIRGLVINGCDGTGIRVESSASNAVIEGNFIGTDPAGTTSDSGFPDNQIFGVAPANLRIGGTTPAARNLISGGLNKITLGMGPSGPAGLIIQGNLIGTDVTGTAALPNGAVGIELRQATNALIGGTSPGARNCISGNNYNGVSLFNGSGSVVAGNFIGVDVSGTQPLGNGAYGVDIEATHVTLGGTAAGAGNVISANSGIGLVLGSSSAPLFSTVQGNFIGTDLTGTLDLGNADRGIHAGAPDNVIGGTGPGEGNIIAHTHITGSFQTGVGVYVPASPRTTIRGNSIFDNEGVGIDNMASGSPDGVTPNDAGDGDTGGNNLQNFPLLSLVEHSATSGTASTRIVGRLGSMASTTYDIDFYGNPACSNFPREFVEGQAYIGSTQVTTDGNGDATFDVTLPVTTEVGARISAIATDPAGNSSEFSQRLAFSVTPTAGPPAGGTAITVKGTDFEAGATLSVGGSPATGVNVTNATTLTAMTPALPPGVANDLVVMNPNGTNGTLPKAFVSHFADVPPANQFYANVIKLVSNGITAGVGGGNFGVNLATLRQQMAVFLLKAKHGLCYAPPPCVGTFADVPCSNIFAPWIEALAAEGITGGCGGPNYCPANPVRRDQMAVFLLKAEHGSSYVPPMCNGDFTDVPCPSIFADWIEQLAAEQVTTGCGGGNYCPGNNNTRGQMAVFIVKTFALQ